MATGLDWIIGYRDREERVSWELFRTGEVPDDAIYGGPVRQEISLSDSDRERLQLSFQVGWSAVGMAASGRDDLGPWGAPTRAGAYPKAPLGLYLLSKDRLKLVLQSSFETALEFHLAQPKYGPIFCDPNLEVTISSAADVHYEPPGVGRRWRSALGFLLGVRR